MLQQVTLRVGMRFGTFVTDPDQSSTSTPKPANPRDESKVQKQQLEHWRSIAKEALNETDKHLPKHLKSFWIELCIVCNRLLWFCRPAKATLGKRIEDWKTHIEVFLRVTRPTVDELAALQRADKGLLKPVEDKEEAKTTFDFLSRHLDIVDDKVSRLLQFQALVFVAIATGAGTMWNTYSSQVVRLHPSAALMLEIVFWAGFFLWFLATGLCFWAIRRVAWGEFEEHEDELMTGRQLHTDLLILENIKRTAKFRVAVPLTASGLVLLLLCLPLTFWLTRESRTSTSGSGCLDNGRSRCDVIIVGAGIAGLSAARELQHLDHSVLILEANNRIGGRAYVGYVGHDKTPIDYGGAWLHGIPTNPLTPLVDSMGFKRQRTEFPYFVKGTKDFAQQRKDFDDAEEKYEKAVTLAAKLVEYEHALGKFARSQDNDRAKKYVPTKAGDTTIDLLTANAGPLESAAELDHTSAVESANFEAGEDDLIDKGMGAFVEKLGDGLPVCLNSRVKEIDYSSGDGVTVTTDGGKVFKGSYALVTVSVGVLRKQRPPIVFTPQGAMKDKLNRIGRLQMGNMQKVIVPLKRDIFHGKLENSWILQEGDLPEEAVRFAQEHKPNPLPLVNETNGKKGVVMGFLIKPLGKNIAIGFFGGDWAMALESKCEREHIEDGSGKANLKCDAFSIEITKSALSKISGEAKIDTDIDQDEIQTTHWSLDPTSFGAYSAAEPGGWAQRQVLAEPLKYDGVERVFFAGEGTARLIYSGSYAGAYESGVKAARGINAAMTEAEEKANDPGRLGSTGKHSDSWAARGLPAEEWACGNQR